MRIFKPINSCDGAYDSLDIRFTKRCDNNCRFCIDKKGTCKLDEATASELAKSAIDSGHKDLLILGGEPCIDMDRLVEFLEIVRPHMNTIYITSSIPPIMKNSPNKVKKMFELINGINFSVHHYNYEINNSILRSNDNFNRIEYMAFLLKNKAYRDKIRVNFNLTKDFCKTKIDVLTMIKEMSKIGCKEIKIVELQDAPRDFVGFEKLFKKKFKSPFTFGCQTDITKYINKKYGKKYNIKNITILLRRSCFIVSEEKNATLLDLIKVLFLKRRKNKFNVMFEDCSIKNTF